MHQLAIEPLGGNLHPFFRGLLPAMNTFPPEWSSIEGVTVETWSLGGNPA